MRAKWSRYETAWNNRGMPRAAQRASAVIAAAGIVALLAGAGARASSGSEAAAPSLTRLVGQTLMGAMDGTEPSRDLLARIRRGELGGVIIFGGNITTPSALAAVVSELQGEAKAGGNPPLLIATDQEGGEVKRLPAGPPAASAETMGMTLRASAVREQGRSTGRYLRGVGVDVDLAPVLDVGDASSSFLGSRIFSPSPALTAKLGSAFATGLQSAGVAATGKHFPGLGTAPANTDVAVVVVPTPKAGLERRLASFRAAVRSGVKLVMVSNAEYPALDPTRLPAALSPKIVSGILRGQLGFHGVVITDTMTAPAIVRYPDAPVRALRAGDDVLLYSDGEALSEHAYGVLMQAARSHRLSLGTLLAANERIQKLKAWLAAH
jgi:beta-N-acetylhexosaminidase